MMTHPGFFFLGSIATMLGGGVTALGADFASRTPDMRWTIAGFVGMVIGAAWGVMTRASINADLLEHARQTGYDEGFQDALPIEPAQVTPLHRVS